MLASFSFFGAGCGVDGLEWIYRVEYVVSAFGQSGRYVLDDYSFGIYSVVLFGVGRGCGGCVVADGVGFGVARIDWRERVAYLVWFFLFFE